MWTNGSSDRRRLPAAELVQVLDLGRRVVDAGADHVGRARDRQQMFAISVTLPLRSRATQCPAPEPVTNRRREPATKPRRSPCTTPCGPSTPRRAWPSVWADLPKAWSLARAGRLS